VPDVLAMVKVFALRLYAYDATRRSFAMLLCKKIKIEVSQRDAATLEWMQGKCRGRAL